MKYFPVFILALAIYACTPSQKTAVRSTVPDGQLVIDGKIWSSLFQQQAAEYKALCIQAYNIARLRVDQFLQNRTSETKPPAIITDIDETLLDNSPFAVHQALRNKEYESEPWYEWTGRGVADTIPGAFGFFTYAAAHKIEIFYVTNRYEREREGTLKNLVHYGLPFANNEHLLLRTGSSSKEDRRQQIAASHNIILLLGDNLSDFSSLFDKKSTAERKEQTARLADLFGTRYIVFPNSNYGGWEDAIYENSRQWTPAQKDSLIKSKLKGY